LDVVKAYQAQVMDVAMNLTVEKSQNRPKPQNQGSFTPPAFRLAANAIEHLDTFDVELQMVPEDVVKMPRKYEEERNNSSTLAEAADCVLWVCGVRRRILRLRTPLKSSGR
jgi:hypothetical protein